jgi:hypothetical protein
MGFILIKKNFRRIELIHQINFYDSIIFSNSDIHYNINALIHSIIYYDKGYPAVV